MRTEILAAMARVYDSDWYVLGEELLGFEHDYSIFNQVPHVVGVANGLEALTLALRALGIGPGDEVLVPSNTYIATWLAISHVGASPIPIEPDLDTNNLDPARLEQARTSRTRAILPVHLYGQPCRMPDILAFAQRHQLLVVEDNAQAQGATFNGQLTGSFGHACATSFYPTKNLGALGDAGAVTTADAIINRRLRLLRNYGADQKNHHEIIGYNMRLDEMQAAILRVKLPFLRIWTAQRRQLAAWYTELLAGAPGLQLPAVAQGAEPVWHLYVVHTPRRNELSQYLANYGISTMVHYPTPPHQQPAYAHLGLSAGALPIAEALAATCLSLPLWPGMSYDMIAEVSRVIMEFCTKK
jgi:dTDP-4-amino-4,6-dideoxygalactose transaminase